MQFKGEQVLKTGYMGDYKSLILYKCPKGYFLFGDKAFGKNNVSWIGDDLDALLENVSDKEIIKRITTEVTGSAAEID